MAFAQSKKNNLLSRTKLFSINIIKLYSSLPSRVEVKILGKQMLRCGTSFGAHYHEAIHSRSNHELTSKIDLGLQELRETSYWLDLLIETTPLKSDLVMKLRKEIDELTAIMIAISTKIKSKANG